MGKLAAEVKESRARRDAARSAFDSRMEQVKQDLKARSLAGRLADKIGIEAREALDEAREIASESKGVAVGTAAALALWYLRNPILSWIEGLFAATNGKQDVATEEAFASVSPEDGEPSDTGDDDLEEVTNF